MLCLLFIIPGQEIKVRLHVLFYLGVSSPGQRLALGSEAAFFHSLGVRLKGQAARARAIAGISSLLLWCLLIK